MSQIQTTITAKDNASSVFKNFAGNIVTLNQGLELLNKAMNALTAPMKAIITEGAKFNQQMSNVAAISKTTEKEFQSLTNEAKRIGETTAFSATQAGSAMEELRRAGQDTATVIKTTGQAMDLAAATGADLATAAQVTAVQLNIFKSSGLEAKKAVDLMVQTVGASPQSFEDLTYALDFSSGTASAVGIDFQNLTNILGAMAESGVRGSKAGTALNSAIAKLSNPAKESVDALAKYGITIDQINPATVKFADIIQLLNEKNVKQSDLFKILGTETAPKFFKVIEAGGTAIDGFAAKQQAANTAAEAARIRLDNLSGDATLFSSALSGLKIEIFDTMNVALRGLVQTSTEMITKITELAKANSETLTAAFNAVIKTIGYLLIGFGELLITFGNILQNDNISSVFSAIQETAKSLWDKGIKPLVLKIGDLYDEFKKVITQNKEFKTAFDAIVDAINGVIKVIGKILLIGLKLIGIFVDVVKFGIGPLVSAIAPLLTEWYKFISLITDELTPVFDGLIKLLDNFSVEGVKRAFSELKTYVNDLLSPFKLVAGAFDWITKKAKALEEQLWVHSTNPAIKDLSEKAIKAGESTRDMGAALIKATADSKKAESQAEKTAAAIAKVGNAGGTGSSGSGTGSSTSGGTGSTTPTGLAGAGAGVVSGVTSAVGGITGVSGATQGFAAGGPWGAVAGALVEIVLAGDGVKEGFGKISAALVDLIAPIGEAMLPTLEALVPLMEDLKPAIKQVANVIKIISTVLMNVVYPTMKLLSKSMAGGAMVINDIMGTLADMWAAFQTIVKPISDFFSTFFENLKSLFNLIFEPIKIVLAPIAKVLQDIYAMLQPLLDAMKDMADAAGGGISDAWNAGASVVGNPAGTIKRIFGWHDGGNVNQKDLLTLPGMSNDEGLAKLQAGEYVMSRDEVSRSSGSGSGVNIIINVKSINPREQTEEIRQLMEELFQTKRLRVS